MPYFLELVAGYIQNKYAGEFEDLCIVIPNRRGGLYLKKQLADLAKSITWVPEIIPAEEFIGKLSGLPVADDLTLTLDLFPVYTRVCGTGSVDFDQFLSWSPQVLHDFNEIDRYLVDSGQVFENLKNIKEIENWSLSGDDLSPMQERYLSFMQNLGKVYIEFKKELLKKGYTWQGLGYRRAFENLVEKGYSLPWKKIIFCGFNALNLAEEKIITYLADHSLAEVLWDADEYYLKDPTQEAGFFLRRYIEKFGNPGGFITKNLLNSHKHIVVTGVAGKMAQVTAASQSLELLLMENKTLERTVVVLADEALLLPTLSTLPKEVEKVNVTLEYPASVSPLFDLYMQILQMQVHKTRKGKETAFYFKEILAVLYNPFFGYLTPGSVQPQEIIEKLTKSNIIYPTRTLLNKWFNTKDVGFNELFADFDTAPSLCRCFCMITEKILEKLNLAGNRSLERESALLFLQKMNILANSLDAYPLLSLKALRLLIRQVLAPLGIPFYGEPLGGLQIMGVLETRTLDFDNVIMLSVNEGVLPSGKSTNSFIPNDLKRYLEMPLYTEKDAIYAYHFYRLLQRAKKIHLIYNTETDTFGKGEKSRFITQVLSEMRTKNPKIKLEEQVLSLPLSPAPEFFVHIVNEGSVHTKFQDHIASGKGLSPTAINTFRECALKFYFRFIEGIREQEAVEEDVESSSLGSIIHNSLEKLYTPWKGKLVSENDIPELKRNYPAITENEFNAVYTEGTGENGKKTIALHVAKKYISKFLVTEEETLLELRSGNSSLKIIALEQELRSELVLSNGEKVTVRGTADRIDEAGGMLRIIDYKSSVYKERDKFDISSLEQVFSEVKFHKALQLLTYAWLAWKKQLAEAHQILPCIIPFRAEKNIYVLKKGKDNFVFSDEFFTAFENQLRVFVERMLAKGRIFEPTADRKICEYCGYKRICCRM